MYIYSNKKNTLFSLPIILFHCVLGLIAAKLAWISLVWGILVLILSLYWVVQSKNKYDEAVICVAYYVGLEVVLRMTGGTLFWEMGKYGIILILLIAIYCERRYYHRNVSWVSAILLLSIPATIQALLWRMNPINDISQNLSGMFTLYICIVYFYKRPLNLRFVLKMLGFFLLPILAMCTTLFIRTPDLSALEFTSTANFATSGGFGPNQVASVLGVGWFILAILMFYRYKFSPYQWVDYALFGYILYRSLFTFSRGGNLVALLALVAFIVIHLLYGNRRVVSIRNIFLLGILGLIGFVGIQYMNEVTHGVFEYRYTGKNTVGEQKEDITSNRINIFNEEIRIFDENVFGVGFGGSAEYRKQLSHDNRNIASHNEFSRLLAEQGIFGVLILMIIFICPLFYWKKLGNADNRAFLMSFLLIAFLTMLHSAIRIALPAFFYGFALIYIKNNGLDSLHRK